VRVRVASRTSGRRKKQGGASEQGNDKAKVSDVRSASPVREGKAKQRAASAADADHVRRSQAVPLHGVRGVEIVDAKRKEG
jgi:hypothetical protein